MTTIENNVRIGKFMGIDYAQPAENKIVYYRNDGQLIHGEENPTELKYHISWDWLMPVVDKIEAMGLHFNIKTNESWIDWLGTENEHLELLQKYDEATFEVNYEATKIESVYKTVLQFVNFYNENKPQSK